MRYLWDLCTWRNGLDDTQKEHSALATRDNLVDVNLGQIELQTVILGSVNDCR